jgi:hypothetical protein
VVQHRGGHPLKKIDELHLQLVALLLELGQVLGVVQPLLRRLRRRGRASITATASATLPLLLLLTTGTAMLLITLRVLTRSAATDG